MSLQWFGRNGNAREHALHDVVGGHVLGECFEGEDDAVTQYVEREVLKQYQGATFPKNYAIAHRGLVETLPNVEPLATQPDFAPYVGKYLRPMNAVSVRVEGGKLVVQEIPNTGDARPVMPIAFFGPDRAVITEGNDRGQGIEFVRDTTGAVTWVRVVGRVAVRIDSS